jgi:hypothetical protein
VTAPLKPLDRVGMMMYTSEVRELLNSLQYRINVMRQSRDRWLHHDQLATKQAGALPGDFDHQAFSAALNETVHAQTTIFDLFEAFFAAWARLSLLVHPVGAKDSKDEMVVWRLKRGELLRNVVALSDDTLLANRSFRDSWMHYDERMDAAWVGGWLGNRHQFVRSAIVATAVKHAVVVIDLEALAFYYRDRDGKKRSVTIDAIAQCLDALATNMEGDAVGRRIVQLLPPPP